MTVRKKIFFALLAFSLSCASIEIGFRVVEFAWVKSNPISIKAKGSNEFRIFVYGGSTVFGEPVPDIGFVAQLRYWLKRYYPQRVIKVYNWGRSGEGSSFVRYKLADTLNQQPDLVIVYSGHNEYLLRSVSEMQARLKYKIEQSFFATIRVLQQVWKKAQIWYNRKHLINLQIKGYDRRSAGFLQKKKQYKKNLNRIVELTQQKGIKLLLCTVAWNVKDWPPVYKGVNSPQYQRQVERLLALDVGKNVDAFAKQLAIFFKQYPKDAMGFFLQGRLLLQKGQKEKAYQSFLSAKELDPYPWRVLDDFNLYIRNLASKKGVFVADVEKAFQQKAQGLVGFDLIADNCHPSPKGSALLAATLMKAIASFVIPHKVPPLLCPLTDFLQSLQHQKVLHLDYLLHNALFSMTPPFSNYRASKWYLQQHIKIDATSWKAWANLGVVYLLEGTRKKGVRALRKALQLNYTFGPHSEDLPYLSVALRKAGLTWKHIKRTKK